MQAFAQQPGNVSVDVKGITTNPNVRALVKEMLELAGLTGNYSLRMTTKLPSHGGRSALSVKVKAPEPSAVRIVVQCNSDNGSRYEGYLSANGGHIKPKDLYDRLMVRIVGGEYVQGAKPADKTPEKAPVVQFPAQSEPKQAAKAPAQRDSCPAASLAGYADDPEIVAIVLKAIYEKHGKAEFPPESFHEIVKKECRDTTNNSAGQLLRRFVEKRYLSSRTLANKVKFYRMDSEGLRLAGVDPANPTSKPALAPDIIDKAIKLQELAKKVEAYQASSVELDRIESQMRECDQRIAEIEQQLSSARGEKSSLELRADAVRKTLEDPAAKQAVEDFNRISAVLG